MAEKLILQTELAASIVRPVFIYGSMLPLGKPSFIQWVQKKLLNGEKIKVWNWLHIIIKPLQWQCSLLFA